MPRSTNTLLDDHVMYPDEAGSESFHGVDRSNRAAVGLEDPAGFCHLAKILKDCQ